MRLCNLRKEDVSFYGTFPEFITKDNVDAEGNIVCELVPLSKEEKLDHARLAGSPELTTLSTVPVEPISYGSRFAIMTSVNEAISRIPSVSDLKNEIENEQ